MPYAVILDIDAAGLSSLDLLNEEIEAIGHHISTPRRLGYTHHLTLAVYDDPDIEKITRALAKIASFCAEIRIVLPSVGCFPGEENILFVAPVVTDELLSLHQRYHDAADQQGHGEAHYHPGAWLPHVTLAVGLTGQELGAIMAALSHRWAPIRCKLRQLRLVRFLPVETIWSGLLSKV